MPRRHWLLDSLNPLEKENQRDACEREQSEQIKIIHERPQMRLLVEQRIHGVVSLLRRGHGIGLMAEHAFGGVKLPHKRRIARRQMPDHQRLMRLRAARKHRRHERDADAAAEISHEIVKPAGIANLILRELAHCRRRQRHENKTYGHAVDDAWPDDIYFAYLQIDVAQNER